MSLTINRQELYTINLGNTPDSNIIGAELANHDKDVFRPCLVIQTTSRLATIIPLSTKGGGDPELMVRVPAGTGNLKKDSYILCYQIRTVDKRRISAYIGELPHEYFNKVLSTLENYLI